MKDEGFARLQNLVVLLLIQRQAMDPGLRVKMKMKIF